MPSVPHAAFDILELFTDRVLLAAPSARNARGETLDNEPKLSYPARVEYETKEVRVNTGEIRMGHVHAYVMAVYVDANGDYVYLDDLPNVTPEWHIQLPDGTEPTILRVDKSYYGDLSHILIYT